MQWPWRKSGGQVKSQKAVQDATESLQQIRSRNPEVHAVSRVLKDIRERNHFAEQLQSIIGGG